VSVPYVTPDAIRAAAGQSELHGIGRNETLALDMLEAAAPHMAKALMDIFAATFDKAASEAKLQPAIHNNIRTMIENYGKAVGPQ